jgi:hypothetical protein
LNGWGGYILPYADYANVFFSHDEYIDFFAKLDENLGGRTTEVRTSSGMQSIGNRVIAEEGHSIGRSIPNSDCITGKWEPT